MVNITFLLGTGIYGQDILNKVPIIRYIDKRNKVFVASRINSNIIMNPHLKNMIGDNVSNLMVNSFQELKKIADEFSFIYDSEYLKKDYNSREIDKLQKWLGISFDYISSLEWAFYDRAKMVDVREHDKLNIYIAGLVQFFKDFFKRNQIKVLINTLEDDIFSVSAYYVAKKMGILVIGQMSSRFPKPGVMFCENFNDICVWNENHVDLDEVRSFYNEKTIVGENTLIENMKYWDLSSFFQRLKGITYLNEYNTFKNELITCNEYEKFIWRRKAILKEIYSYIIEVLRRHLIKPILKDPNFNDDYFLFPLHYTKDAQITFREPFFDQFELIREISRSLPSNCKLYVKPHPHYLGSDTCLTDLFNISKIENVKIINPTYPPINLIQNSNGVITLNSTSGVEALIMDVPLITFGHDFYCKSDLCYLIKDKNNLAEAIMEILGGNYRVNKKTVNFIKKVYANIIWLETTISTPESKHWGTMESDGKNIAFALNIILDNLGNENKNNL